VTVAACFIQRDAGGAALRAARFVDLRGERTWDAPSLARTLDQPREVIVALARWISERVSASPGKPDVLMVLDADGSACGWLSTDSSEQRVVRAAVRDALSTDEDDSASSLGWMSGLTPGSDTSVQALVDVAQPARGVRDDSSAGKRQRLGLLAVSDLTVRLLLDELDGLGVQVRRVTSVWHAMAAVNAPASAGDRAEGAGVVAEDTVPASASVMLLEPQGRLLWAWASGPGLLCAGSIQLRESIDQAGAEEREAAASARGLRLSGAPDGDPDRSEDGHDGGGRASSGRDGGRDGNRAAATSSVLEVTRSDVGRLVADWMGWSMQLGVSPQRISVVGTPTVTCSGLEFDLPEMAGVAAVAAGLGKAWPGASVQAGLSADPLGDMLRVLVSAETEAERLPGAAMAVDPRLSVVDLSARPGRSSRALHLWGGLALLAAAVGVGVLGWRIGRSGGDLRLGLKLAGENRVDLMSKAGALGAKVPADSPDPVAVITSRIIAIQNERKEMREEDPLLAEAVRFLKAAEGVPDVQLRSLSLSSQNLATAELMVPGGGDQGPTILDRLRASSTGLARQARWDGRTLRVEGTRRQFNVMGKFEDATPAQRKVLEVAPLTTPVGPSGPGPAGDPSAGSATGVPSGPPPSAPTDAPNGTSTGTPTSPTPEPRP